MSTGVDVDNDDLLQRSASLLLLAQSPQSPAFSTSDPSRASSVGPSSSSSSLKRAASPDLGESDSGSRKRMREDESVEVSNVLVASNVDVMDCDHSSKQPLVDGGALVEDLGIELECGCCAGLVYKPVIVSPCEHFFCGSCCVLWIRNGGTNCPKCRGPSSSIVPSKPLQAIADILARADPSRARSEKERAQADEVYPEPRSLKFPVPREPSPEPAIPSTTEFLRPCPHCSLGNAYGYTCPSPIQDPDIDTHNAWPLDDGAPEGHAFCGNCENVLAVRAPQTSKCDFCQVSFCGINVHGRCSALPLTAQQPHNMSDVGDLIQSAEVYDCFDGNTVEVEFMLDHMAAQGYTPRHVYKEIVQFYASKPNGFAPMFDVDLFADIHSVLPVGPDPDPSAPRRRICRSCASEVLLFGLREWWIEERRKGFLEGPMVDRRDCPEGRECRQQQDLGHAREFNHVIVQPVSAPVPAPLPMPTIFNPTPAVSSSSSSPAVSREGSVVTGLPHIRELLASSYMMPPPEFTGIPSASNGILQGTGGPATSSIPFPPVPDAFMSRTGNFQERRLGFTAQEGGSSALSSISGSASLSMPVEGGQEGSANVGHVSADYNAFQLEAREYVTRRQSDDALDAAMDRRLESELEAHYVAAITQALARSEEAQADLMAIRSQLQLTDGMDWNTAYNVSGQSHSSSSPAETSLGSGHSAVALPSQLAAE